jgi:hypothetical protein
MNMNMNILEKRQAQYLFAPNGLGSTKSLPEGL